MLEGKDEKFNFSFLKIIHLGMEKLLKKSGYEFEIRNRGEIKVGLWRKKWRSVRHQDGADRRIVFLPGWGDTPSGWIAVFGVIQNLLRFKYDEIIFVDYPGYRGFLSEELGFEKFDHMLEVTYDLLETLKAEVLIGYSMGGWIATRYILWKKTQPREEKKIRSYFLPKKLILVDPGGVYGSEKDHQILKDKFQLVLDHEYEAFRSLMFHQEPKWFKKLGDELKDFLKKPEIDPFLNSIRENHYLKKEDLEEFPVQTVLLWGEKDQLVVPKFSRTWLKAHPSSELITLKNSGHCPQLEVPFRLAYTLLSVLLGVNPPVKLNLIEVKS